MLDKVSESLIQNIYRLHVSSDFIGVIRWLEDELKENDKIARHAPAETVQVWQGRGQAIEAILKQFTDAPSKMKSLQK